MMAFTRRLCSKWVPFSSLRVGERCGYAEANLFQIYERVEISLVVVHKRGREICQRAA